MKRHRVAVSTSSCPARRTDQRWTLARIKTLIGRLFHVSYIVEGTWQLLKRHGWSWQQPARRAIERDDAAVEVWRKETWPLVRAKPASR